MSVTRYKLNEAQYFLNKIEEIQNSTNPGRQRMEDAFRYNLSAYLAAARSITDVMKNEYRRVQGFSSWYQVKINEFEKDEIMVYLRKIRNLTIHEGSTQSRGIKMIISTDYFEDDNDDNKEANGEDELIVVSQVYGSEQTSQSGAAPIPSSTEEKIQLEWFFDKFQPNNVLTVCGVQLSKLRLLVNECESKFWILLEGQVCE